MYNQRFHFLESNLIGQLQSMYQNPVEQMIREKALAMGAEKKANEKMCWGAGGNAKEKVIVKIRSRFSEHTRSQRNLFLKSVFLFS